MSEPRPAPLTVDFNRARGLRDLCLRFDALIDRDPGLPNARDLQNLFRQIYSFAVEHNMLRTLAAMELLVGIYAELPIEECRRNDGTSVFVHLLGQTYYEIWKQQHQDEVERVVTERWSRGSAKTADVALRSHIERRLAADLQKDTLDTQCAGSLLHDVVEDELRPTIPVLIKDMRTHVQGFIHSTLPFRYFADLGDFTDGMTRRRLSDGSWENRGFYYTPRSAATLGSARGKARDRLHNHSTLFLAGIPFEKIETKLADSDQFVGLCFQIHAGNSISLLYDCYQLQEQALQTRRYMRIDWSHREADSREKGALLQWIQATVNGYSKIASVPAFVNPQHLIALRMMRDLNQRHRAGELGIPELTVP